MSLEQILAGVGIVVLVLLLLRPLAYVAGIVVGLVRWWRSPERRIRRRRQKAIDAMARVGRDRRSRDDS